MFKLLRYFSIASFIAMVIVTAFLAMFYHHVAFKDLIKLGEDKNIALTRAFSNSVWPQFSPFLTSVSGLSGDELRAHPETTKLHQAVLAMTNDLSVVKVKIYNLDGLTVFSTDPSQIGDDNITNPGFLSAESGKIASAVTHRGEIYAFEGTIEDRDILSSYLPIRQGDQGSPIEGVFELYSDITSLVEAIQRTQRNVVGGVILILGSLYVVLFFIVRHADRLIKSQDASRKRAEERLSYLAHHDALTNLPNRMLFIDRLGQALSRAPWHKRLAAVLFLDLDHFKRINDTLGHTMGDLLLKEVAKRLAQCSRQGDTVARMGGDEFTIILADIAHAQDVPKVAQKIIDIFSKRFVVGDHEIFITTSVGISLYPDDGEDPEALLKNADAAMYRAKEIGRNTYQYFSIDMNTKASERLALETDLRHALEREEFLVHYQPQVDLNTGQIIGMEALVRWQHPDLGLVPPAKFIPLAEDTGLIAPIGEWVLRTACAQNKAWQTAGLPPIRVGVNLSARQFQCQNLVEMIVRILKETGLDPTYLELELTESVLMQNTEAIIATLCELDAMGINISIDDFGTGYSSLSYLKRFPINRLKIDQSFVRDITTDPDDAAIVTAIITLAHSLKLKVIAEAVETEEQLAFLRSLNCDEMQGYLFSRPLPMDEATKFWREKAF